MVESESEMKFHLLNQGNILNSCLFLYFSSSATASVAFKSKKSTFSKSSDILSSHLSLMQHQHRLPSFAEVIAIDKNDPSRLPSYREARRFRFHPYSRHIPVLVDVDEADRLLNTVYDDERVVLDVPPPLPHPRQPQVVDEFEERLRHNLERAIASELRVQRLSTVIVEFVAGITGATRG